MKIRTALFFALVSARTAIGVEPEEAQKVPRGSPMMREDLSESLKVEEPRIEARQRRIDAELDALDRNGLKESDWAKEWAGKYYTGDGLGENVSIHLAPKAGISFMNHGCLGLYGGDHGDVVEALPDGLRLKLVFGSAKESFLSERVYFVKWGPHRFLVPEWQMMEFVNNYNEGGFARETMFGIAFLQGKGDNTRIPEIDAATQATKPQLPAKFAKLLLSAPVSLKTSRVSSPAVLQGLDSRVTQVTAEFEGGSAKGVYVGLRFKYPADKMVEHGIFEVTRVDAETCTAEFHSYENDEVRLPAAGEVIWVGEKTQKEPPRDETKK